MKIINNIKNNLRRGTGEAMAFIALLPTVIVIMYALFNMVQLTSLRQKMEYTAYSACRAAVVSSTRKEAVKNAEKVAQIELARYSSIVDPSTVKTKIRLIKNVVKPALPVDGAADAGTDSRDSAQTRRNKRSGWIRGSFVELTLSFNLKKTNFILGGERKEMKITMALEKEDY